jgi:hypothetical protein
MSKGMSLIRFEIQSIEDRAASIASGGYKAKDIEVAVITPVGGRLEVPIEVTEELLRQWKINPDDKYRHEAYLAWKEGAEPPVNGSSLKEWPPISPSQLKELNARNIRSIEELAELPDDYLPSFGPGYRALRDKAREWLRSAKDIGQVVSQVTVLRDQVKELQESEKKKDALIEQLLERLDKESETPKRGRPPKVA